MSRSRTFLKSFVPMTQYHIFGFSEKPKKKKKKTRIKIVSGTKLTVKYILLNISDLVKLKYSFYLRGYADISWLKKVLRSLLPVP